MSIRHPTISAWQRDAHTGHFETELHGWKLRVAWHPNTRERRGYFTWEASRDDVTRPSPDHYEELEEAMADAEIFAAADAARRSAAIAAAADL